jgi:MFS family permease
MRAARSPVVLMAAILLFINYVDRGTASIAAPLIQADLSLDYRHIGLLLSAFFWTYTVMQIPMGWLAERFGGHRILFLGLLLWASATLLTGLAHSFITLMMLRLLLGLGESAGFPCVAKVLAETVPAKGLGFANGIVGFAYTLGPAVGSFAGGKLMDAYGWRSAFLVFGAISLIWLWPWSRVSKQIGAAHAKVVAGNTPSFGDILKTPAMWGTGLGLFSSNYVFYFMLTWLPSYLMRERGFSTVEMGAINGSAFALNALSALAAGWAIDRYIKRGGSGNLAYKGVMAVSQIGNVICMLCMAWGDKPIALAAMFIYQVLCGSASPGVYAMSQILAGPKASGRWVGVQNCMGSLAGVVSPAVTGFTIQATGHFTNAFIVAAAVSVLGLVGWIWMIPKLQELPWDPRQSKEPVGVLT